MFYEVCVHWKNGVGVKIANETDKTYNPLFSWTIHDDKKKWLQHAKRPWYSYYISKTS